MASQASATSRVHLYRTKPLRHQVPFSGTHGWHPSTVRPDLKFGAQHHAGGQDIDLFAAVTVSRQYGAASHRKYVTVALFSHWSGLGGVPVMKTWPDHSSARDRISS
jgi:hypothetical protein